MPATEPMAASIYPVNGKDGFGQINAQCGNGRHGSLPLSMLDDEKTECFPASGCNAGRGRFNGSAGVGRGMPFRSLGVMNKSVLRGLLVLSLLLGMAKLAFAQPIGGTSVSFEVTDARLGQIELSGRLWQPSTTPAGVAAVVIVHGSAGWSDYREGHYARAFAGAGFTVLAIDSFGPRGIATTTEDQSQVSALQMTRDAFAASRFLETQGIPIERQALMGFSKGGAAVLFAADRTFLPGQTRRFAAGLAFYPACSTRALTPKPASPIFMALGDKDDYSGVEPCQEVASAFRATGGQVNTIIYPDATHAFDGDPAHTGIRHLRFVENYMQCRLLVEEDGSMNLGGRRFAPADPTVLSVMRTTCMRKGASIWTNLRQKGRATADAIAFVKHVFAVQPR